MLELKPNCQRGWVSLPIIALLLALSTLSVHYQQRLQAAFQWRGQLDDVNQEQQVWTEFVDQVVANPNFSIATPSECRGFCPIRIHSHNQRWQQGGQSLRYRWEGYQAVLDEPSRRSNFYRLCATQNQYQYRCWWWQESQLLSSGWVTTQY